MRKLSLADFSEEIHEVSCIAGVCFVGADVAVR